MMVKTDRRKSKAKYDFHKNHIFLPDIKGKEKRQKEEEEKEGEEETMRREKKKGKTGKKNTFSPFLKRGNSEVSANNVIS